MTPNVLLGPNVKQHLTKIQAPCCMGKNECSVNVTEFDKVAFKASRLSVQFPTIKCCLVFELALEMMKLFGKILNYHHSLDVPFIVYRTSSTLHPPSPIPHPL